MPKSSWSSLLQLHGIMEKCGPFRPWILWFCRRERGQLFPWCLRSRFNAFKVSWSALFLTLWFQLPLESPLWDGMVLSSCWNLVLDANFPSSQIPGVCWSNPRTLLDVAFQPETCWASGCPPHQSSSFSLQPKHLPRGLQCAHTTWGALEHRICCLHS